MCLLCLALGLELSLHTPLFRQSAFSQEAPGGNYIPGSLRTKVNKGQTQPEAME